MIPLINIHTHHSIIDNEHSISIINDIFEKDFLTPSNRCSVGIHPWYIAEDWQSQLGSLGQFLNENEIFAIGECGLDRLRGPEMEVQKEVFMHQIDLALQLKKPLIIHCVKAFDELIRLKKAMKISPIMIVHGYNKNQKIAQQLLENGFYLSFGKDIWTSKNLEVLKICPIDRMFFETDDCLDCDILTQYQMAADYLDMNLEILKRKVYANFINIQ